VTLERAADTVVVPDQYRQQFVQNIRERLYGTSEKPGPFTEGAGLTIRIKVIQFDAGSQFERWFWGGIGNAGEGSLQVLAEFYEAQAKIANIQTEGRQRLLQGLRNSRRQAEESPMIANLSDRRRAAWTIIAHPETATRMEPAFRSHAA
jgi:hypothetical protein